MYLFIPQPSVGAFSLQADAWCGWSKHPQHSPLGLDRHSAHRGEQVCVSGVENQFLSSVSQLGTSDLPPADGKRESPPSGKGWDWAERPRLRRAQPPTLISSFTGRRRVSFRSQRSHGKTGAERALGFHRLPSSLIGTTRGYQGSCSRLQDGDEGSTAAGWQRWALWRGP